MMYRDRGVRSLLVEKIKRDKVVAIFRNVSFETLLKQVDLLLENGITIMEITLNSDNALNSIEELKKRYGEDISLGAGTVVDVNDVVRVKNLGAEFIISPNVDVGVIKKTKELGLLSIPGAFTPSELFEAHKSGADMIKIFPAKVLGLSYVKHLKGPFPDISFMATGGIDEINANDYIESGYEALGIGSALTTIANGDMDEFRKKLEIFKNL